MTHGVNIFLHGNKDYSTEKSEDSKGLRSTPSSLKYKLPSTSTGLRLSYYVFGESKGVDSELWHFIKAQVYQTWEKEKG